jgi:hypothetical protein
MRCIFIGLRSEKERKMHEIEGVYNVPQFESIQRGARCLYLFTNKNENQTRADLYLARYKYIYLKFCLFNSLFLSLSLVNDENIRFETIDTNENSK